MGITQAPDEIDGHPVLEAKLLRDGGYRLLVWRKDNKTHRYMVVTTDADGELIRRVFFTTIGFAVDRWANSPEKKRTVL